MTLDPKALEAWAGRLEAAPRPERQLDAEIMLDLFARPSGVAADGGPKGYVCSGENPPWFFGLRFPGKDRPWFKQVQRPGDGTFIIERDGAFVLMHNHRIPPITASLDAALDIVRRLLDIEWLRLDEWPYIQGPPATASILTHDDPKVCCASRAATLPFAVMGALFRTMAARRDTHVD